MGTAEAPSHLRWLEDHLHAGAGAFGRVGSDDCPVLAEAEAIAAASRVFSSNSPWMQGVAEVHGLFSGRCQLLCEHSRGVDEADLETFDFAEPAILLGLGDPVVQLLVRPDTAISAPHARQQCVHNPRSHHRFGHYTVTERPSVTDMTIIGYARAQDARQGRAPKPASPPPEPGHDGDQHRGGQLGWGSPAARRPGRLRVPVARHPPARGGSRVTRPGVGPIRRPAPLLPRPVWTLAGDVRGRAECLSAALASDDRAGVAGSTAQTAKSCGPASSRPTARSATSN